jgi:glycosyltransferase involved in cell wall biosynthesis
MIPVYNGTAYLRETLESVLSQDPGAGDMQIEVIDNCSDADDPESVVAEIGGGRVTFYRQPQNVGVIGNFNECLRRATGQWVHVLHADDTVRPGFYQRLRDGLTAHPEAKAAACRFIHMDEDSHWMSIAELESRGPAVLGDEFFTKLFVKQRFVSAALVVHRAVYEEIGGFRPELPHCADWDMWKRIAFYHQIFYEPEPLACYRVHAQSDMGRLVTTGANVVEERRSILLSYAEMPRGKVARYYRSAMKQAGVHAIAHARRLWLNGNHRAAWRQIREGLRCSMGPAVMARVVFFFAQMVVR